MYRMLRYLSSTDSETMCVLYGSWSHWSVTDTLSPHNFMIAKAALWKSESTKKEVMKIREKDKQFVHDRR